MNAFGLVVIAGILGPAATPSVETVQAALWSTPMVHVSGEFASFSYGTPPRVLRHATFDVKYERASGRVRFTQKAKNREGVMERIEVWGTFECLNLFKSSVHLQGMAAYERKDCANAAHLSGWLGHQSGLALVLDRLRTGAVLQPGGSTMPTTVNPHAEGLEFTVSTPQGEVQHRAWLTADGSAIRYAQIGPASGGTRIRFVTHSKAIDDSAWVYMPTADEEILARTVGKGDEASRAELEKLAKKGNRDAQVALGMRTLGPLLVGYGSRNLEIETVWSDLDKLGKLGVAMALGMQGRILAYAPNAEALPKAVRGLSEGERINRGKALMWRAAELCDKDTLDELGQVYSLRITDIPSRKSVFEPNAIKLSELARVSTACEEKMYDPVVAAAFADPWPPPDGRFR